MNKRFLFSLSLLALALGIARPVEAGSPSVMLEQRLKASYNTMVQDVRGEPSPVAKRALLDGFLGRMDNGLGTVEALLPATHPSHVAATAMRTRIQADRAELGSIDLRAPTAAADLNGFASFLQQDVEQADGVYLSVGAIIIILLILILVL